MYGTINNNVGRRLLNYAGTFKYNSTNISLGIDRFLDIDKGERY